MAEERLGLNCRSLVQCCVHCAANVQQSMLQNWTVNLRDSCVSTERKHVIGCSLRDSALRASELPE